MKHEILHLNKNRVYVMVDNVWYDTHIELNPKVGQSFLTGKIEKVLSYDEYTSEYPDSKNEMFAQISEKTMSGGFIRRAQGGLVKYAINPATPQPTARQKESLLD